MKGQRSDAFNVQASNWSSHQNVLTNPKCPSKFDLVGSFNLVGPKTPQCWVVNSIQLFSQLFVMWYCSKHFLWNLRKCHPKDCVKSNCEWWNFFTQLDSNCNSNSVWNGFIEFDSVENCTQSTMQLSIDFWHDLVNFECHEFDISHFWHKLFHFILLWWLFVLCVNSTCPVFPLLWIWNNVLACEAVPPHVFVAQFHCKKFEVSTKHNANLKFWAIHLKNCQPQKDHIWHSKLICFVWKVCKKLAVAVSFCHLMQHLSSARSQRLPIALQVLVHTWSNFPKGKVTMRFKTIFFHCHIVLFWSKLFLALQLQCTIQNACECPMKSGQNLFPKRSFLQWCICNLNGIPWTLVLCLWLRKQSILLEFLTAWKSSRQCQNQNRWNLHSTSLSLHF